MEERLCFIARLLEGEPMAALCREFGISRKTGYKIFDRYKEHGQEALNDRSRRPVRYANQLPQQVESLIVTAKRNKPHWGGARFASFWSADWMAISGCRRRAPFMRSSIGMAWFSACAGRVTVPAEHLCRKALPPMIFGAPISKVSSSSATTDIAIRSPLQTMLHVSCCCARRSNPHAKTSLAPHLNGCFATAASQ